MRGALVGAARHGAHGAALCAFAAEGVGHVQLVLDPITVETIAARASALALFAA